LSDKKIISQGAANGDIFAFKGMIKPLDRSV
jgi:hypothetical protein